MIVRIVSVNSNKMTWKIWKGKSRPANRKKNLIYNACIFSLVYYLQLFLLYGMTKCIDFEKNQ